MSAPIGRWRCVPLDRGCPGRLMSTLPELDLPVGADWSAWLDDAERIGLVTSAGRRLALPHSLAMAAALERALRRSGSEELGKAPGAGLERLDETEPAQPLARIVDLGSGAGLPGLVIAGVLPGVEVLLVEASRRRVQFLDTWAAALGLGDRVTVWNGRAEVLGREPAHRGRATAVVARGFGPPATAAECAAPLLSVGGVLVVSDPPAGRGSVDRGPLAWEAPRWPPEGLAVLGLQPLERQVAPFSLSVMRKVGTTPERYPRRVGVPAKRPLFGTGAGAR